MKKVLFPIVALVLAVGLALPMAAVVGAADETWASVVYGDPVQGTQKDGDPVYPERSIKANALGPIDHDFFSLGYIGGSPEDGYVGGYIILGFADFVGTYITVYEQSPPVADGYDLEQAKVYVSAEDPALDNWTYLGIARNDTPELYPPDDRSHPNTFDLTTCIKWVKIVDITDPRPFTGNADAFDVDAVCAGPCQKCADLIAGQHIPVGDVNVWNDDTSLYVQYVLDDPWVMTESHLHVAKTELLDTVPDDWDTSGIPQTQPNKKGLGGGNPIPGHFDYSDPHGPVTEYTYTIDLGDWEPCTDLVIAAHAVVQKVIEEAPYYAASVDSYWQGTLNTGNAIPASWNRSTPAAVLALNDPLWFFSLGFGEPNNGWIIVEFDCPIRNGDGNDVQILEVTNASPYPSETANVFASLDGSTWIPLGQADNSDQAYPVGLTASEFDLGSLSWAKYIKVEDTSERIPDYEGKPTDAFDLEVVVSLQDCIQEETAWGYCLENGGDFPGKNWATYFTYHVQ